MNRAVPTLLLLLPALVSPAVTSAAELLVGKGLLYERPSEVAEVARDGDTILIQGGDYYGDVAVWTQDDLTFTGVNGRPRLVADGKSAEGKGIWVIKGNNAVVENIEFSGAVVDDKNGAGIRLEGRHLTVRRCHFHHNENGILTGADPRSNILIEESEFGYNGHGDGYSHNMYIGRVASFEIRSSYVHHAVVGHQVKSRAKVNRILYNRLMDERSGTSSYLIDLPNDGEALIVGNVLQQGPETENWAMIRSVQATSITHNTFKNDRSGGIFIDLVGEAAGSLVANNLFAGNGRIEPGHAQVRNNLTTTRPELENDLRFDYRLTVGSPAIDKGGDLPSGLVPEFVYEHPRALRNRTVIDRPDVGAYELEGDRR